MRGGAIAGLIIIAVVGLLLVNSHARLRHFLTGLVGTEAAFWGIVLLWVAFTYSAIGAGVTALDYILEPEADPSAVAFGRGALSQSILPFLDRFMRVAEIGVLALAAILFFRGVQSAKRGDSA